MDIRKIENKKLILRIGHSKLKKTAAFLLNLHPKCVNTAVPP